MTELEIISARLAGLEKTFVQLGRNFWGYISGLCTGKTPQMVCGARRDDARHSSIRHRSSCDALADLSSLYCQAVYSQMRSVGHHLEDALSSLMLAKDAAIMFHHEPQEIEKIRLLIRATNKVRSELTDHRCELRARQDA